MPLIHGDTPSMISKNARDAHPKGYADGGMPMSMAEPWFERREASAMPFHPGGLYQGTTGGRTDNITNLVPAGAYVVPADVVSGLGEGNSMAGAAIMDKMFHTNPHGIQGSHIKSGVGIPHPPASFNENKQFAKGGAVNDPVPVVTAAGEFLIHPDAIIRKFGSLKRGHLILDDFVQHYRKKTAKTMLSLKGPKR